ncbi:MAG: hypothetical protein M0Q94_12620 [Candidatus Cloacimonetes bacterium]|nr:hypothetical protein [Candidatus Cloacimonadota bacterium]
MKPLEIFAQVQYGLENIALKELESLNITNYQRYKGGFEIIGHWNTIYLLNNQGLCFSRILIRLNRFIAKTFYDLEKEIKKIDFKPYLNNFNNICIRVNSITSSLYHENAIKERIFKYISKQCNKTFNLVGEADTTDTQLILLTAQHDQFILSIDTSGQHLHKRGYLDYRAKAPLRETIATAMFISLNKTDYDIIIDPFCGGGTIPIEISRFLSTINSDTFRSFNFMKWNTFNKDYYKKIIKNTKKSINIKSEIYGYDISEENINIAIRNLTLFNQVNTIKINFLKQDFFNLNDNFFDDYQSPLIISNPPWGKRLNNIDFIRILKKLKVYENHVEIVLIIPECFLKLIKSYKTLFNIEAGNIIVSAIKINEI